MRGQKTPITAFITRLIYTTPQEKVREILTHSPLTTREKVLFLLYADGASYKELARIFNVTTQAIYYEKRKVYEKLYYYLMENIS